MSARALEALFEFPPVPDYKSWKKLVQNITSAAGKVLMRCDEEMLTAVVEAAERRVFQAFEGDRDEIIKQLTIITIYIKFMRSQSAMRGCVAFMTQCIHQEDRTIVRIACRLMYIATKYCTGGSTVVQLIKHDRDILGWINEKRSQFAALCFMKESTKAGMQESITFVESAFPDVFKLCLSEDREVQTEAVKVLIYNIKQQKANCTRAFIEGRVAAIVAQLPALDSDMAYGPVLTLIGLQNNFAYLEGHNAILDAMIKITERCGHPTDLIAAQSLLKVTRRSKDMSDYNEWIKVMCRKGKTFVPVIAKFIHVMTESDLTELDATPVIEFLENYSFDGDEAYCPFLIVDAILSRAPETKLKVDKHICRNLAACAERNMSVISEEVWEITRNSFRERSGSEELLVTSLRLARLYPEKFSSDMDDFIQVLSLYYKCPHSSVRQEVVKILGTLDSEAAIDHTLSASLMDIDKSVRYTGVEFIQPSPKLATKPSLLQLLHDRSFKVRRATLKVLGAIAHYNPLEIIPYVSDYIERLNDALITSRDMKFSAKLASLYPTICTHVRGSLTDSLSVSILSLCLNLLDEYNNGDNMNEKPAHAQTKFGVDVKQRYRITKPETPRRAKVIKVCEEKYHKKRDGYLLSAIAKLGAICEPHLSTILSTFSGILGSYESTSILRVAILSLIELSSQVFNGLNIRLRCPQLIVPLGRIIRSTNDEELCIAAIRLLGGSFDAVDLYIMQKSQTDTRTDGIITSDYDTTIVESIFSTFQEVNLHVLKVLTTAARTNPYCIAKHIEQVVHLFLNEIKNENVTGRITTFQYFEILVAHCGNELVPLLPEIMGVIGQHINMKECIRFIGALSFYLGSEFIAEATNLFSTLLIRMLICDITEFKDIVKCLTYMTVKQSQSIELFLVAIEEFEWKASHAEFISEAIMNIAQAIDISMYFSRLMLLGKKLCILTPQFVYSLISSGPLSEAAIGVTDMDESIKDAIQEYTSQSSTYVQEKLPMMYEVPTFPGEDTVRKLDFMTIEVPELKQVDKWHADLVSNFILWSPYPVIRETMPLISNHEFFKVVFPLAFLACWRIATPEERDHFSNVVNALLATRTSITDTLVELIEVADHAFLPMKVDVLLVGSVSKSSHFSVKLLENYIRLGGERKSEAIELLLDVNSRMGHYQAVKGLFKHYGHIIQPMSQAKWLGYLGRWDKALDIYMSIKAPFRKWMKCYRKLHMTAKVLEMEEEYYKMPKEDQAKASGIMMWALFYEKERHKMKNVLTRYEHEYFHANSGFLGMVCHELMSSQLVFSDMLIKESFESLYRRRTVFEANDYKQINNFLNDAQSIVECQEAVEQRREKIVDLKTLKEKWGHRVKGFRRDVINWERFISLRDCIIPIADNVEFYMKIMAALRKDGQLTVIQTHFFQTYFARNFTLSLLFEYTKLMSVIGQDEDATVLMEEWAEVIEKYKDSESVKKTLMTHGIYFQDSWISICTKLGKKTMPNLYAQICEMFGDEDSIVDNFSKLSTDEKREHISMLMRTHWGELYRNLYFPVGQMYDQDTAFKARLYRRTAGMIAKKRDYTPELKTAIHYYENALELAPKDARNWRGWAYANSSMFYMMKNGIMESGGRVKLLRSMLIGDLVFSDTLFDNVVKTELSQIVNDELASQLYTTEIETTRQGSPGKFKLIKNQSTTSSTSSPFDMLDRDYTKYAENAIKGFLKAIEIDSANSLGYLCKMFSVLFSLETSATLEPSILEEISRLDAHSIHQVVPQMAVHIGHKDEKIRDLVCSLLYKHSFLSFETAYYALSMHANSGSSDLKSQTAAKMISKYRQEKPALTYECELFCTGMVRCAETWFESWIRLIEETAKQENAGNTDMLFDIIQKELDIYKHPQCEIDFMFIEQYGAQIDEIEKLIAARDISVCKVLHVLYESLREQVNRLSCIILRKASAELSKKTDFIMKMPRSLTTRVKYIDGILEVLGTQQHPRCLHMVSETGERHEFLLKGREDVRVDERLMQFFMLINNVLSHTRKTRELEASICCYGVLPLTLSTGLISWVTNASTIQKLVNMNRARKEYKGPTELDIVMRETDSSFNNLNFLQKLEIYKDSICKSPEFAQDLVDILWFKAPTASAWSDVKRRFTVSTALMSIVGYIIGLGDRHPGNIMIQEGTGNVIHIDFGESFDSARNRKHCPEKVPFRLTPMIVNALESRITNGIFQHVCEEVLRAMRENQNPLISQLSIFVHEPIGDLAGMKRRGATGIHKSYRKLMGQENIGTPETVRAQVERLINEATEPMNYLQHYSGWCPLW